MRRPPRPPARQAAFTILEVLAAFVVLALTLGALMQVFAGGLREAQLADEYARAVQVAQSRLAAFTAADRIEEGGSGGTDDGFAWTLAAAPYDESQENAEAERGKDYGLRVRLLRVEARVAWHAADGNDRNVRLTTLVMVGKT